MMHSSLPRRTFLGAATMGGLAAMGLPVWAQSTWPSRPVNMVVPFPAGGGTDAFARPMAAQFQRLTNRQLVINNIGGGGGTVGASSASKNTPDGYNFFMGAVHHAIAPSMYPRLDYDILTDFEPVLLLASVPQVLVVNPRQIDVNTYAEFVELVRRNPGRYNYGSAGNGTSHHLAGELYKLQTNTFITHIPYRGAGPALADLVAGNVEMMFDGLGSSAGHIQGGRIKALMVSGTERNASLPDVPCSAELGLPDYQVTTWYGVWAPKGTPDAAKQRAADEMRKAVQADEAKATWARQGAEFPNLAGAQFGEFVRNEVTKWSDVVRRSGAKID